MKDHPLVIKSTLQLKQRAFGGLSFGELVLTSLLGIGEKTIFWRSKK